jgi:hypothetical protein
VLKKIGLKQAPAKYRPE